MTGTLLHHLGVKVRMIRYDDHADERVREGILTLAAESAVALVSDAGTPLISDPGFRLVREARERGIAVTSLPGPSALIVALTLAGLPTDRFVFAGFLPTKAKARGAALEELAAVRATLVFYESGPRLVASLEAIGAVLPSREVAVARELTKLFEECRTGNASELADHYRAQPARGEIVLLVGPPVDSATVLSADEIDRLLAAALEHAKASQAAGEIARLHSLDRKTLYARALALQGK